jgi:hypothetical protein
LKRRFWDINSGIIGSGIEDNMMVISWGWKRQAGYAQIPGQVSGFMHFEATLSLYWILPLGSMNRRISNEIKLGT